MSTQELAKSEKAKSFKKKKKPVLKEVDPINFNELVEAAEGLVTDVFIPDEEHRTLVEVNDWITMPEPICDILSTPGLPCGHIVECLGGPDSGKSSLATHALIGAQNDGGIAILIDTEHKFDIDRAVAMGLNRGGFIITRAETIEDVFEKYVAWMKLIRSKEKWLERKVAMVWDSLGATPCRDELDETTKDHNMRAAHAITAGLRKTRYFLRKTNAAFLMINQVYQKQTKTPWEKKTTGRGGMSPEYFSSIRLEFTRIGKIAKTIKGEKIKVGITSNIEAIKNHMGVPFRSARLEIDRKGIVYGRKAEL